MDGLTGSKSGIRQPLVLTKNPDRNLTLAVNLSESKKSSVILTFSLCIHIYGVQTTWPASVALRRGNVETWLQRKSPILTSNSSEKQFSTLVMP